MLTKYELQRITVLPCLPLVNCWYLLLPHGVLYIQIWLIFINLVTLNSQNMRILNVVEKLPICKLYKIKFQKALFLRDCFTNMMCV